MAIHRVLDRWHGVRVLVRWDTRKLVATIEPDEDDLVTVSHAELYRFWIRVQNWASVFSQRYPEYRVNGATPITVENEDDIEL